MCVISLSFNLLLASKLTHCSKCCFIFFNNFCFIQYLHTKKMIDLGKERSVLCFLLHNKALLTDVSRFSIYSLVHSTCTYVNIDLWHYRIGCPFSQTDIHTLNLSCCKTSQRYKFCCMPLCKTIHNGFSNL